MATPIGFDPTIYTSATAAPFTLGAIYSGTDGRLFRYVYNNSGVSLTNGTVCCWNNSSTYTVIGAQRTTGLVGTPTAQAVAGVAVGTIPTTMYGFILIRGIHQSVLAAAAGTQTLQRKQKAYVATAVNDSGTDVVNAYDPDFGVALTTASGGVYTVDVRC